MTQGSNIRALKKQSVANRRNAYFDSNLRRVEIVGVEQVIAGCVFKRGSQWIEGGLVSAKRELKPDVIVQYGTDAYTRVLNTLIQQGRQGVIARKGDILLRVNDRNVLVQNRFPKSPKPANPAKGKGK